jgi:hypothetical protein
MQNPRRRIAVVYASGAFRVCARRVLGDVHHPQTLLHREPDGLFGGLLQELDRPALGVLADRAGADEGTALDRDAGPLNSLGNRPDIRDHRARRAVRGDLQPPIGDRAGQALDVGGHMRARAGKTDVRRVDPEDVHPLEQIELLLDRRGAHRRRLQPITQRLVVEHHRRPAGGAFSVPIVNERMEQRH